MAKVRRLSGADVVKILEGQDFRWSRTSGDHKIMVKETPATATSPKSTRTVPVPLHKELRPGTLSSIIRQSGLERALFEVKERKGHGEMAL